MSKKFLHPRVDDIQLTKVLEALADPIRMEILANIRKKGALSCSDACTMGLPKSTISHHFRILRESGLVRTEKLGVAHCNTLRDKELNRRFPGLLAAVFAVAFEGKRRRGRKRAHHSL